MLAIPSANTLALVAVRSALVNFANPVLAQLATLPNLEIFPRVPSPLDTRPPGIANPTIESKTPLIVLNLKN